MKHERSICFVASASSTTGAGHVVRCARYAKYLNSLGFDTHLRGNVSLDWLSTECIGIFKTISNEIGNEFFEILVVDSYEKSLLDKAVLLITSTVKIQIADSSTPVLKGFSIVWLDVTPYADTLPTYSKVLGSGLSYFPIQKLSITKNLNMASNVLLVTGATPNTDFVFKLIRLFESEIYRNIQFHLLSVDFANNLPDNWNLHRVGSTLKELLLVCDTVISASGTSLWDFIANQIPVGAIKIAQNQEQNYNFAVQQKLVIGLNDGLVDPSLVYDSLEMLFFDLEERKNLSKRGSRLADFRGVERFSKLIIESCSE